MLTSSVTENFILGLHQLGAPTPTDANNGEAIGVFSVTHSQDPSTQTRSSARTAYYDSARTRENLHLLTGTQVTRLLTSIGNRTAARVLGVEVRLYESSRNLI